MSTRTLLLGQWLADRFSLVAVLARVSQCGPVSGGVAPSARPFDLTTLGLVRYPVDLTTPDRAVTRGQPSTQPATTSVELYPRAAV